MTSHENCSHEASKAARAACRKATAASAAKYAAERAALAAQPFHVRMNREYRVEDHDEYALDQEAVFVGQCEYCENTTTVVATKQKINMCGRCVKHVNRHITSIDPIHNWTGESITPETNWDRLPDEEK